MEEGEINGSLCEICSTAIHKYKCSVCQKTKCCSSACMKKHSDSCKRQDPFAFVPLATFDDSHLKKDYSWLEGVKEHIEKCSNESNQEKKQKAFKKFRSTRCFTLPDTFARHRSNQTRFENGKIFWSVEVKFESCSKIYHNIEEESLAATIVNGFLPRTLAYSVQLECLNEKEQQISWKHIENLSQPLSECLKNESIVEFPLFLLRIK